jgi:RNA polymerase sigma factor (sigma-70 family)
MTPPASAVATDEQLVAAARAGSDEAFEALFRRYRDRIEAHVRGMVYDHGRAEDIVQDTFMSALRSLRATDQEIAFKPWIYQIARNACIDHLRRVKRAEEVSIDSDEFKPDFEGRLSETAPTTDFTVLQKQELADLRQAFGGLPPSQHEILVLRELEGLSYQEIGSRMHLTPAAVESMLSRARRSLKGQYDEIATGDLCRRMRPVMVAVAGGLAGKRDRRTLERHVRHCRVCRHEALAMGLDALVSDGARTGARGPLSRAAALLPLPWFLRRRGEPAEETSGVSATGAHGALSHLNAIGGMGAEQTASALQKVAAVVAVAAVAGGGIVAHEAGVGLPLVGSSSHKQGSDLERTPGPGGPVAVDSDSSDVVKSPDGEALPAGVPDALDGFIAPVAGPVAGGGSPGGDLPSTGEQGEGGSGNGDGGLPDSTAPVGVQGPDLLAPDASELPVKPPAKDRSGKVKTPSTEPDGAGSRGPKSGREVPPGILRAPGLDGRLPPGIERTRGTEGSDTSLAPVLPKDGKDKKLDSGSLSSPAS